MCANFTRQASGNRFVFEGLKTNSSADAMPEHKFPIAVNVRGYRDHSVQSRPQVVQFQAAPGVGPGPVIGLEPNIGVYKIGSAIYVAGAQIDTGYAAGLGVSFVPFRPNASPNAWDYIFDNSKSTKVYVPSSGAPVVNKVGIAEPQSAPDACPDYFLNLIEDAVAASWTPAGTAGAVTDITRSTEVLGADPVVFADPASSPTPIRGFTPVSRVSVRVGTTQQYQVGELVAISTVGQGIVQDVIPNFSGTNVFVRSVTYYAGLSGRCSIALSAVPGAELLPDVTAGFITTNLQTAQTILSAFRRGALINIASGTPEVVMILSATQGPDGSLSIEVSTANNQTAATSIALLPTIVLDLTTSVLAGGKTLSSSGISSTLAAGTATLTNSTISGLTTPLQFIDTTTAGRASNSLIRPDDYFHFSINVSDINQLSTAGPSIRIMFDVNNGAADFASNFYYYDIQTSDLAAAIANTQTQLGAASVAAQRQALRGGLSDAGIGGVRSIGGLSPVPNVDIGSVDFGSGGTQTSTGVSQWTEVMFSLTALTRVGNDETRTMVNMQAYRVQVIALGAVTIKLSSFWFGGGETPDVGQVGAPYLYRVRPRSSVTGAIGNPSPATRYGISPHRQQNVVSLPSAAYDTQIDTWDVFRSGGQIGDWKYVGSAPSSSATYVDNVFDSFIISSQGLTFDELEPFPSIGPSITASAATVSGTAMVATFPLATAAAGLNAAGTLSQLGNLLPGNLFNVGNQVFTLFNRPVFVSSTATTQTYLFQFVENAGAQTNPFVSCQEPALANQQTNAVWGPDENGVVFSVGAGPSGVALRPGLIQWTNPNDPDGCSDKNTSDICAPTEPLLNGALVGGTSIAFSANRAWAGYPKGDGSGYRWVPIPVGAGLAADVAICSDGKYVYFVAKDGIRRTAGGASESLTDADLYNLFPHEGIFPVNVTYAGQTVFFPEYKYAANFRLAAVNGFLYFDYLDSTQTQRTLVCDLRTIAWSVDVGATAFTIHAGATSSSSNNQIPATATRTQQLFIGDTSGAIQVEQSSPTPGVGEIVACVLATKEEILGDLRAKKIFGDASLDILAAGGAVTATPVFLGNTFGTSTVLAGAQVNRTDPPAAINLLGGQIQRSMGLLLLWFDQGQTTTIYDWQPSYIPQPEDTANRFTDWDNAGSENAKFFQGFELEADTSNTIKSFIVRDADTLQIHPFSSALGVNQVQHNGQQIKAYSFVTPFVAHLVRIEPQDNVSWRFFGVKFEGQPTPESVLNWQTQGSSLGLTGYMHIQHIMAAYISSAPVTLTITAFDGVSPAVVILPSTGGVYKKLSFLLTPNKGLLYTFQATSSQPWTPFLADWEIEVKKWGSDGPYGTYRNIGGVHGAMASI